MSLLFRSVAFTGVSVSPKGSSFLCPFHHFPPSLQCSRSVHLNLSPCCLWICPLSWVRKAVAGYCGTGVPLPSLGWGFSTAHCDGIFPLESGPLLGRRTWEGFTLAAFLFPLPGPQGGSALDPNHENPVAFLEGKLIKVWGPTVTVAPGFAQLHTSQYSAAKNWSKWPIK